MIRHLPYFIVVAEEQHFQRAAQRLNMAQSALSRRIKDLEHQLGDVPLFLRLPQGVRLTPSGVALLEDARQIMAQVQSARDRAVTIMNGDSGALHVGYSAGAARHAFIGKLIGAFRTVLPDIRLDTRLLSVEALIDQLRSGDLSAAIFYTEPFDDDLESIEIDREEYLLAIPSTHALADAASLHFDEISAEDFVWYAEGAAPTMRRRLLEAFRSRGVEPRIAIDSPSADATMRLVGAGLGLGFVTRSYEAQPYPGTTLRQLEDFSLTTSLRFVWLGANTSPLLARLVETVSGGF
jgi:DNA-binding transcriptional LysR family regulator